MKNRSDLITSIFCCALLALLLFVTGCKWDGGVHLSTAGFYPDQISDHKVGDPRKGMFQPGYEQSHFAGGSQGTKMRPGEKR